MHPLLLLHASELKLSHNTRSLSRTWPRVSPTVFQGISLHLSRFRVKRSEARALHWIEVAMGTNAGHTLADYLCLDSLSLLARHLTDSPSIASYELDLAAGSAHTSTSVLTRRTTTTKLLSPMLHLAKIAWDSYEHSRASVTPLHASKPSAI